MKRTAFNRRTPLKAGSSVLRRGVLVRQSALSRTAMAKPSRPSVSREEREARRLVRLRSLGRCERCGQAPMTEWSHRRARSQGGPWCASNGLAMCSPCHAACHASPALSYERGWHVRSTSNPAITPVFLAGLGWSLLRPDGSTAPYESRAA